MPTSTVSLLSCMAAIRGSPQSSPRKILAKARILEESPELGHPLSADGRYRQLVLVVLRAQYVFRYRIDADRLVMLRVFHGRERRS